MELIQKTFTVLEALSGRDEPLSLGELTERVTLPKPTVYRIVDSLVQSGYVQKSGRPGHYELTRKLLRIAEGNCHGALIQKATPLMEALHDQFNETVNLGIWERHEVRYLHVLETTQPLRWILKPGERDSLYTTALGKAILAGLDDNEAVKQLRAAMARDWISEASYRKLNSALPRIRNQGWADDREHTVDGVICLGISLDFLGYPNAAVSIAIPSPRHLKERETEIIRTLDRFRQSDSAELQSVA